MNRKYTICSIYLPPNEPVSYVELVRLLQQLPKPFLLLGDFNSRHPMWGDIVTNNKGNLIASLIENEDLTLLNTGEATHYHQPTGTMSCIDLSITSSDCVIDFNWNLSEDWHTSDHSPIIINCNDNPLVQRSPRWCLEKADWPKYRDLSKIEGSADEFHRVDDAIDLLNGTLHTAGVNSIPRSTGIFHRRPVPWWCEELRILHRATRRALTRCRRHRTDENLTNYKKCRAQFRRAMKAASRQSWSAFITNINSRTPQSTIWKKVRKVAGKYTPSPPPVLKVGGQLVTSPLEVGNVFAEHFANVSRKSREAPGFDFRQRQELNGLNFKTHRNEAYNLPFSEKEYDSALKSCNDTAPGPDDIPYALIKNVSRSTKHFIISILNRIWRNSEYPSIWELAVILGFLKPGKDKFLATSYRPIALTCCLCKVMEKMVNARLVWYLEKNGILTPAQCGFRRMHSTTDVLLRLEN